VSAPAEPSAPAPPREPAATPPARIEPAVAEPRPSSAVVTGSVQLAPADLADGQVRALRLFGDPVLRTECEPVASYDAELRVLVRDLARTLAEERGAGLAAPQIGVSARVFVFDVPGPDGRVSGHLVNPGLDFPDDDEQDGPEGCLSIPGLYFDTKRRQNVVAKGFNAYGDPVQVVGTGLMARCLQHETDHLDGVLFVDRLDPATRREAMRAIRDADWSGEPAPTVKVSPHHIHGRLG
jgi:peptide deformylase